MKRVDAFGHNGNRFTDGNPTTNTPATDIEEEMLNSFQEELANTVEGAGFTLDGSKEDQLFTAIKSIISVGGEQTPVALTNNAGPLDLGLKYRNTLIQSVHLKFDLRSRTDTVSEQHREVGEITLLWDYEANEWDPTLIVNYLVGQGDSGVSFSVADFEDGGLDYAKFQYTCTELDGANYLREIKILDVKTVNK